MAIDYGSLLSNFAGGSSGGGNGGGGSLYSINPTATANTDVKTGALTQGFNFGGINTGTQSTLPPWSIPAALVALTILGGIYLWRR